VTVSLFRPRLAGAMFSLLAGAALAAKPAADLPSLDVTPRPNQHQRQTIDMQATMNMQILPRAEASDEDKAKAQQAQAAMPMTMKMRMQQTLHTGSLRTDGWIPLSLDHRTQEMSMTTATGVAIPVPASQAGNLKIAARFNPKDFAFEFENVQGQEPLDERLKPMMNNLMNQVLGMAKAMRDQKLKVGDSFEMPMNVAMPMPGQGLDGGQLKGQMRYTLTRIDKGVAYFDLGVKLDINAAITPPAGASAPAAGPVNMTAEGSGQGQFALRLSDRLALTNDMTMQTLMTISAPNGDVVKMTMDMTMKGRGESLKPAAVKR